METRRVRDWQLLYSTNLANSSFQSPSAWFTPPAQIRRERPFCCDRARLNSNWPGSSDDHDEAFEWFQTTSGHDCPEVPLAVALSLAGVAFKVDIRQVTGPANLGAVTCTEFYVLFGGKVELSDMSYASEPLAYRNYSCDKHSEFVTVTMHEECMKPATQIDPDLITQFFGENELLPAAAESVCDPNE